MLEVPRSLPNVFILAIGVVLGTGLLSFILQLIKTKIFIRKLLMNRVNTTLYLAKVLDKLGLTNKVILVNDNNLFSFCCGIFSPHIVVTTGLVQSLTDKELEAVLLHEQSHLLSRDPVKVLIGKTFSSMFFFLPIFADLHKNIEAVNELLADQWTISRQQNSTFLRGALKKILASPQLNFSTVSNASGPDYFEIRINRLVNPGTKHRLRLSSVSFITTFLFIFFSWFLLQTPVSAFHMDSKSDSTYFLCSDNQSCSKQCHPYFEQSTNYIPAHLFLPEKKCDDDPKNVSRPLLTTQAFKYQTPLLNR
ncbi:MAG: M56 family metallopeptidase [Patescibacteria group bacterium]|nr:M56 family metallopeptidase [Actinomycetota bacterium]MCL5438912.1 M56 family metallopeptidase [Patescibacteria group bacterium]